MKTWNIEPSVLTCALKMYISAGSENVTKQKKKITHGKQVKKEWLTKL